MASRISSFRGERKLQKAYILAGVFLLGSLAGWSGAGRSGSQHLKGSVSERLTVDSRILDRSVSYRVYLPPGYSESKSTYPVVYLLHGGGGSEDTFVEGFGIHLVSDSLISIGAMEPMILVMPDGGNTRYLNNHDNSVRYEDFFFEEFLATVESTFRINSEKGHRAVAGTSMGGFGSLVYALRHPELFSASVSVGGSFCEEERVLGMTTDQWNNSTRGPVYGLDLAPGERLTDHFLASDPCFMVQNTDLEEIRTVGLYLDCGDDDFRNDGNAALHTLMRRLSVPHEYRVRDGGHTRAYMKRGVTEGLQYISRIFSEPSG